jgi:hypothetical protein
MLSAAAWGTPVGSAQLRLATVLALSPEKVAGSLVLTVPPVTPAPGADGMVNQVDPVGKDTTSESV